MAKKVITISHAELRKMQKKIEAENRKKSKRAERKSDGFSEHLKSRYRMALREVWQRQSAARKICLKRADIGGGFSRCELCKKKVPKVYVDHIVPCGDILEPEFLHRLSVPSSGLQALCKPCHDTKTAQDKKALRKRREEPEGFY